MTIFLNGVEKYPCILPAGVKVSVIFHSWTTQTGVARRRGDIIGSSYYDLNSCWSVTLILLDGDAKFFKDFHHGKGETHIL
jgi:hypothetical protein